MTLNELKLSVAKLGFESDIENTEEFLIASDRALQILTRDRPTVKTAKIPNFAPEVIFKEKEFRHSPLKEEHFTLPVGAYTFRVCGEGIFEIKNMYETETVPFNAEILQVADFAKHPSILTFKGDCSYTVSGLAFYGNMKTKKVSDIPPYDKYRYLKLNDIIPDFLSAKSLPTSNGKTVKDCSIQEGILKIPFEFSDEMDLEYIKCPRTVLDLDFSAEIDCPKDSCHLLPLLVSSFIWLDDDEEKAQYYLALYKEGVSILKSYTGTTVDTKYTTNGWA